MKDKIFKSDAEMIGYLNYARSIINETDTSLLEIIDRFSKLSRVCAAADRTSQRAQRIGNQDMWKVSSYDMEILDKYLKESYA